MRKTQKGNWKYFGSDKERDWYYDEKGFLIQVEKDTGKVKRQVRSYRVDGSLDNIYWK